MMPVQATGGGYALLPGPSLGLKLWMSPFWAALPSHYETEPSGVWYPGLVRADPSSLLLGVVPASLCWEERQTLLFPGVVQAEPRGYWICLPIIYLHIPALTHLVPRQNFPRRYCLKIPALSCTPFPLYCWTQLDQAGLSVWFNRWGRGDSSVLEVGGISSSPSPTVYLLSGSLPKTSPEK